MKQPDPQGLTRVELVSGEQPPHRVAPPGLLRQPDGGAAERVDPATHLHLRKPGVGSRDPDVSGQQQLDAERHAPAMRGGDDGLCPRPVQSPWIATVVGERQLPTDDVRSDVHQVEAGSEVVAMCEEDTRPQGVVGLQQPVRTGQVGEHRQVERIALVRSVQADGQHVAIAFQRDGVEVQLRCCHQASQARGA